jgi:hypothetical protein
MASAAYELAVDVADAAFGGPLSRLWGSRFRAVGRVALWSLLVYCVLEHELC